MISLLTVSPFCRFLRVVVMFAPHDNGQAKAFSSERKEGVLPTTREGEEGQEQVVGGSVEGLADGAVSGWSTDTEAFLPVLAELSSLSDVSYAPVSQWPTITEDHSK